MKFLVLTDLHQKTENIPWINSLVDEYSPDALLYLGDITDMGPVMLHALEAHREGCE